MTKKYFTEQEAIERIKEVVDEYEIHYIDDIRFEVVGHDPYIIGSRKSEQALEEYGTFKAIGEIQEYEEMHFGEVHTDLSNPEDVSRALWDLIVQRVFYDVIEVYELEEYDDQETLTNISNKCEELLKEF